MPTHEFESNATVYVTNDNGEAMTCSGLLERDAGFLKWNRMSLIGTRDDMVNAMRIQGEGPVRWELHNRTDWPDGKVREDRHLTSGTGAFRSIGMASGIAIADDSIQKFADLQLYDCVETTIGGIKGLSAQYWFLQRPRGWHAYARRPRRRETRSAYGDWRVIVSLKLKFRMVSVGYSRRDDRISHEIELIHLPAIEIEPIEVMEPEAFFAAADELWFSLRILILFRYRQYAQTLAEFREQPGRLTQTWHDAELRPREVPKDFDEPPFFGATDIFFARAAARLATHSEQRELLHAAAYGYANSYKSFMLEGGLTSCIEGIERLVTAFEAVQGLSREVVDRKKWKPVSAALKGTIDGLGLHKAAAARVKRSLAMPATLSLQERIERMVRHYRRHWRERQRELLPGLDGMIKARNDIVHGRLVADLNHIHVELLRARAIFERLFLNFLGCHALETSGQAQVALLYLEHRKREKEAAGAPTPDGTAAT